MRLSLGFLLFLVFAAGCGTAKTTYIDTKYQLCRDACQLKYSKYESQKYNACISECNKDKYQQK